jgi:hypothetical protein
MEDPLEISTDRIDGTTHKLNVRQHVRGIYTLIVDFYNVENMNVPEMLSARIVRDCTIMTLTPADPRAAWNYSLVSKCVPGYVNPTNVDSAFVYRLPVKSTEKKRVHKTRYVLKDSITVDYSGAGFEMNRNDTVCAARNGVVLYVVDEYEPVVLEGGMIAMSQEHNYVDVQHDDGTIASYGALEKGSIPVKPGSMVYAGMPIARAGTLDGKRYGFYFHLFYQKDNLSQITELRQHLVKYHYIDPVFATSRGEIQLTNGAYYSH